MSDGMDCTCAAYSESECCCGADWTPQEVIDLRKQLAEREKQVVELRDTLKETVAALEHRWEVIANRAAPVMESVIDAAHTRGIQALSATQDLSGLVLCEAKPVAWMREHVGVTNSIDTEIERATFTIPLFKARKA